MPEIDAFSDGFFDALRWVALGFAGLVVAGWLCVTAMAPGRARTSVEWLSATALFAALFSWFVRLCHNQWAAGNTVLLVPFGFLAGVFGLGLLVSVAKTLGALRGRSAGEASATH